MRNCERCGEAISSARLVALPQATHCVDCARERERLKATLGAALGYGSEAALQAALLDWSRFGEAKDGEVKAQPAERNAQERAERTPYRIAEGLEEHGE